MMGKRSKSREFPSELASNEKGGNLARRAWHMDS